MKDTTRRVTAVLDGYRVTSPARQLFGAAVGLPARGHASAIVVINRASGTTPLLAEANRLKLDTTVVRDSFPGDVRVVRRLRRAVIRTRAQVLETHGYKPNILAALLKPTLGVPWIAFLHGETRENAKVRLYFALERLAVRLADRVVVVSEDMARVAAGFGVRKDRLRVIHNVYVPPSTHGDAAASTDLPERDPVIGVVARLSPEKGVDVAIRVHQMVVRDRPNARLLVLGEGPERGSLAALTAQLGLADHITWAGYQDEPDRFYRGMDVVLIPSRSEGLPQVALEAMAHGLPVVATPGRRPPGSNRGRHERLPCSDG